jgi:hypothetical protein
MGILPVLAAVAVAGCASKSSEITPSYVSPIMYQNHTCAQLAAEAQGVSSRAAQVSGAQDQKRTNDQIATGVAIVVFWPAAFLVGGDGPTAAELAQLKGQMVAIEQASVQKNCGIRFQRTAAAGDPASAQGAAPPVVYAEPPPPPASAGRSKQASAAKSKAGQVRTQQPAPASVVAPAPVEMEPVISEADRTMNSRN